MQKKLKQYFPLMCVIISLVLSLGKGLSYSMYEPKKTEVVKQVVKENQQANVLNDETVFIDLKGEVKNPGVYEVYSDTTIDKAIEKAGGLTTKANTDYLNLSKKVADEMVVVVYSEKEVETLNKVEEPKPELKQEEPKVEEKIEVEEEPKEEKEEPKEEEKPIEDTKTEENAEESNKPSNESENETTQKESEETGKNTTEVTKEAEEKKKEVKTTETKTEKTNPTVKQETKKETTKKKHQNQQPKKPLKPKVLMYLNIKETSTLTKSKKVELILS